MPRNIDIADDVLMTLGFNHDDRVLHRPAALYNMGIIIDRLKKQRLEKDLAVGVRSVGSESTTYIVPISQETYLKDRNYFTLPSNVYDLSMNGGIEYVAYNTESGCEDNLVGKRFTLSTPSEIDMLYGSEMQRPSPYNPYFFRSRLNTGDGLFTDRVWLVGISPLATSVEVGLYLTFGDIEDLDPEAEVDLPADMVYLVKINMLNLARWVLLVPQQRLRVDGRDFDVNAQPLQPPNAVSVNDQINRSEA